MAECRSFLYRIDAKSKILILGSMPGIKSLEMQQYYAHPQNRFWKVMGVLCGCLNLYDLEYEKKIEILLENGYALWDVVGFCNRAGSLDSNIKNEKPNDILKLLQEYPNIGTIVLNGNKSYSAFKKHFPELLKKYRCCKMPSTSPANAKFRLENLLEEWEKIK